MNINTLLRDDYEKWKDRNYVFERNNDEFKGISFKKFIEDTYSIAKFLIENGLTNKKIIIYGPNSYEIMITDLAVTSFVGISVLISNNSDENTIIEIAKKLEAKAIIYDNSKSDIIDKVKNKYNHMLFLNMNDFNTILKKVSLFDLQTRDNNICSKIVFSSGSTGPSKAVKLSIKNIFSGYQDLRKRVQFNENDKDYLFLPLNHTYGNIYNFYYSLIDGYSIYIASSNSNIVEELLMVNPTFFCAVPLIYKRLLDNYKSKINMAFGTNIKYLFCGGSVCSKEIRDAFRDLNLMQAYALSETSSSLAIDYSTKTDSLEATNSNDKGDYSSGTILESIDVKIYNPDKNGIGEIIVKGDNVCIGYVEEKLNKKAFDEDGYFHTEDLGYIEDNKIYLKGRKNKIINEIK